jgi:hypothetical protein
LRQKSIKALLRAANWAEARRHRSGDTGRKRGRRQMSVLVFILLTVVIFALLGLIQKLVEGL